MGFFSYECAKSKISIPAANTGLPYAASNVVLVLPDDTTITGLYDGYGRVDGHEIWPLIKPFAKPGDSDTYTLLEKYIRMVRADHYKGERYADLKKSKPCKYQGYFYPEAYLKKIKRSLPPLKLSA